ncbi:hypothetical protein ACFQMA_01035 [Halosimplex aquaticum]|uniref:Uncharacterized protein n=1 Tax=Halosimplex aquaticum TaxID=3026162 RepID=A0ABD5XTE5_9EURY|nr:hypothetical protein [Halosimplex aquaticum]
MLPIGAILLWLASSPSLTVAVLLVAVAGIWLAVRSVRSRFGTDDAGTRAEAGGQPATVTARSQTPAVRRSIGQRIADGEFFERGDVLAVTASVATVAAATAVVAADYRGSYAGSVKLAAAVLPFAAFSALGYLVTRRQRSAHRAVGVAAAAAGPWLFQFASTVEGGDLLSGLAAMLLLPLGYPVGAVVLFYVALWFSTR